MFWADININIEASAKRPLTNGQKVRLLFGTEWVGGTVVLPYGEAVSPGESTSARCALEGPLGILTGETFTIRSSGNDIGTGTLLSLHTPNPDLGEKQQVKARQIEERLLANPYQPLLWSLIAKELFYFNPQEGEEIRRYLEEAGTIVHVDEDLYFHMEAVASAEKLIREYLEHNGSITSGQARDLLGSSRKFIIPLLEYFDAQGITVRRGNQRVLP